MNSTTTIEAIERAAQRSDLPPFRPGDTIAVHALISEGGKERVQVFEGVCIHRKRQGGRGSFTVRKISSSGGVGVERVFPENSPRVVKVELKSRGKVRQAKLYYLRNLRGNAARIKSRLGDYGELFAKQSAMIEEAKAKAAAELAPDTSGEGESSEEAKGEEA